jgi:hypothetical protein
LAQNLLNELIGILRKSKARKNIIMAAETANEENLTASDNVSCGLMLKDVPFSQVVVLFPIALGSVQTPSKTLYCVSTIPAWDKRPLKKLNIPVSSSTVN